MKKKWFSLVLAFVLFLTSTICLTACGGVGKNYFTMENPPKHCEVSFSNYGSNNDGKQYVEKGREVEIYVNVEEGYFSSNFAMYINTQKVELIKNYRDTGIVESYIYRFTPQFEFKITFGGSFEQVRKHFQIRKEIRTEADGPYAPFDVTKPENSEVYLRFGEHNPYNFSTEEITLADYVNGFYGNGRQLTLSYGTKLDFYIYTKGYKGAPSAYEFELVENYPNARINEEKEFYHEDDKIGYHVTYTQGYYLTNLIFQNATFNTNYYFRESSNGLYGTKNFGSKKFKMQLNDDLSTLTISFNRWNEIPSATKATFANLKLKINEQDQNINFTQSETGVFTINLKHPYEYVTTANLDNAFTLIIDLNYYSNTYLKSGNVTSFDGEVFDSSVSGKTFSFAALDLLNSDGIVLMPDVIEGNATLEQLAAEIDEVRQALYRQGESLTATCEADGTVSSNCTFGEYGTPYQYTYHNDFRENTVEFILKNEDTGATKTFVGNLLGETLKLTADIGNGYKWQITFCLMDAQN